MNCIRFLQTYFDEFMGAITDLFGTPPSPPGVYATKPLIKRDSDDIVDDKSSVYSDIKPMSNFSSERRRSTTYLMKEKQLLTDPIRRSSVQTEPSSSDRLKVLAFRNSYINSSSKGDDFRLGSLSFDLNYAPLSRTLQIRVNEAKNLPAVDKGGECDPYLKIIIYPGNFSVLKTHTQYKTRNPKFNETKIFTDVAESDLKLMTMNVKVFDWNRLHNDRIIGEINYSLSLLADAPVQNNKKTSYFEKNIVPIKDTDSYRGLLLLALYLDMSKQELIVSIIKGKDLKAMDRNNLSDPYCVVKLSSSNTKLGTRKTSVKKKTLNPIWKESFPFHVTQKDFADNLTLKIKVFDKDPVGSDFIGEVIFSSESSFIEKRHWKKMIQTQKEASAEWHNLKSGN